MSGSARRTIGRLLGFVVLVTCAGGIYLLSTRAESAPEEPGVSEVRRIPVRLTAAARMDFEDSVSLVGTATAKKYAMVAARVKGTLDAVYVDEGDAVIDGKTELFKTDALKLEKELKIAQLELAVAECSVRVRRANDERVVAALHNAQLDLERHQTLFEEDNVVSKSEVESKELLYLQLQADRKFSLTQIELAERRCDQVRGRVEIAEKDLADTLVRAPIGGVVTRRFKEPGEMANTDAPVLRIEDPSVLEISCLVPAVYRARVEARRTEMDFLVGGDHVSRVVSWVSPTIDARLRTFEARCDFEDPPRGAVAGAKAEIRLVLERRSGLGVPAVSVVQRGGRQVVFVREAGIARMIAVKTGLRTDGHVELLADAIEEGVEVVSQGQFLLNDGTPIRVLAE